VGYVNVVIPPNSFVLVTTPLMGTTNDLYTLFAGLTPPDNTTFKVWENAGGGAFNTYTKRLNGTWTGGYDGHPLNPGMGYFIQNGNLTTWLTNTFVGDVLQGTNQASMKVTYTGNATTPVFNLIGCPTPTAGLLQTDLQFVPTALGLNAGDRVWQFDTASQSYLQVNRFTTRANPWAPAQPTIAVAEGFWLEAVASGTWQRNFTVQ